LIELAEKSELLRELTERLTTEYKTLLAAQKATVEGATHEEAKPENDKDTRALEQSYLARGQAERVVTLKADLETLARFRLRGFDEETPISFGAIVNTEDETEREQLYFLAPSGAGELLESSAGPVKVVTGQSPLGRVLLGSREGEDVEVQSPTGKRILSLTAIC